MVGVHDLNNLGHSETIWNDLERSGGFLPGPYYTLCTIITRIRYYYIILLLSQYDMQNFVEYLISRDAGFRRILE